ncbi:hypothetical protein BHF71_05945 [Vulcanibacillus modesticaldus]|uniref:Uncharacterized protein n=1 Tax=Vulcanibacillus modesticaldus TaxID=337097 RepID=A0A1D2YWZ1_9BACI|nr:hypothetical protein [Vulcanibacillus modesticaldus]OEG00143.1 hypothetical protein BHF71_05945 [Vulcanibacillus modesticaldus]
MGYSDTKGDFEWANAIEFANTIGLTSRNNNIFTRGSMVDISYRALNINLKDSQNTLLEKIKAYRAISGIPIEEPYVIVFKDKIIEKEVRDILDRKEGKIFNTDLEGIHFLFLSSYHDGNIKSLDDLKFSQI